MKIMMVTIHNPLQKILIEEDTLGKYNIIKTFDIVDNSWFSDLAIKIQKQGHQVSYISNFSSAPHSIKIINKLENNSINVYPDLQEKITYDVSILSKTKSYSLKNQKKLSLNNYHKNHIKDSEYIITNEVDFEFLNKIHAINQSRIIVVDNIPMYRALDFVEGIVLNETPENMDETILSLIHSGLSWIAINTSEGFLFNTLKHRIKLNIDDTAMFISEFLNSIESNSLLKWIEKRKHG